MRVFLGDLVHTGGQVSVWTMPLNIGFVSSYANSQLGGQLDNTLYKRPEIIIRDILENPPDVLALSYYVWNIQLNNLITRIARNANKEMLIIGGGPIFTNENRDLSSASNFFLEHPSVDAFILNQGEIGFCDLIATYIDSKCDRGSLLSKSRIGALINGPKQIFIGEDPGVLEDLNAIPSPYLTGQLDSFFSEPISPIIETNRSCPYRCTFCAWGIGTQKLSQFNTERVINEIEYIAQKNPLSATWFIADANFGILERDELISKKLSEVSQKYGNPQHVAAQWNKTRPDRVYAAAKHLYDISQVGASMQSLHEPTLLAIKRKNLPLEDVKSMTDRLNLEGADIRLFSELIIPLPEETFESHLDANRKLWAIGAEVFNYNLHLLPGTEMDSQGTRDKYFTDTGYRLHDNAFGTYHGEKIFESQEVVLSTSSMTRSEVSSLRFIHFLMQYMWQRKYHIEYLKYLEKLGHSPVDVIVKLSDLLKKNLNLKEVYENFYSLYSYESFPNKEELFNFWSLDENYKMLTNGEYGKLNALFTFKIESNYLAYFQAFLLDSAKSFFQNVGVDISNQYLDEIKDVLKFSELSRVTLTENGIEQSRNGNFKYNIVDWKAKNFESTISPYECNTTVNFLASEEQASNLNRLLMQFKSNSWNTTLRKMTEYSKPETFFYQTIF